MRTSLVEWPFPAGGAQCFPQHSGRYSARCAPPLPGQRGFIMGGPMSSPALMRARLGHPQGGIYPTPSHVNQDVDGVSLPATAWPRQTHWATRPAPRGHGGGRGCSGTFFALMLVRPGVVVQYGFGGPFFALMLVPSGKW